MMVVIKNVIDELHIPMLDGKSNKPYPAWEYLVPSILSLTQRPLKYRKITGFFFPTVFV